MRTWYVMAATISIMSLGSVSGYAAETFKDCDVCPEMVTVPTGSFEMGDQTGRGFHQELPVHKVTFAKPFAIGAYEVTFDEWDACVADGGCSQKPADNTFGRGRQPVINVSWHDANEYVAWLSQKTGKNYRLPTEPEWEYSAKAGSSTDYPWGDDIGVGKATCLKCNGDKNPRKKLPVGSFEPNAFGLYDTVGNVAEWTADCFLWKSTDVGYDVTLKDVDPGPNCYRVVRGGSWNDVPRVVRSASREWHNDYVRNGLTGLRVVRDEVP